MKKRMNKIVSFVLAMIFTLTLLPSGLTASADSTPAVNLGSVTLTGSTYSFNSLTVTGTGIKTILISFTDNVAEGDAIKLPDSTDVYETFKVSDTSAANNYTKRISIAAGADCTAVQSYLRGVGFTIASGTHTSQTVRIIVTTEEIGYDTFYNIDTQHYYRYIPYVTTDTKDWVTAYTIAKSMHFMGRTGYLATIKDKNEDEFVNSLSGSKTGWLGGTRLAYTTYTDGQYYDGFNTNDINTTTAAYWYWACGPERSHKFFD